MAKIPRLLLDRELYKDIKPLKGTLSFNSLTAEKINIICNLYDYFIKTGKDAELFTLPQLFKICCPNEALTQTNKKDRLKRFENLLMSIEGNRYSHPVRTGDGKINLIDERLFALKRIVRIEDNAEVKEYFKVCGVYEDRRFKMIYAIKPSEILASEIKKYTVFEKNYIESEVLCLGNSRGKKAKKIKSIQQVLNEELALKKLRKKKKQPFDLVSEFEINEFVTKMGELQTLKKDRSRYLISFTEAVKAMIDSEYPITAFELIEKKKLRITFGGV